MEKRILCQDAEMFQPSTCPLGGSTLRHLQEFMGELQGKVGDLQQAIEEQTISAFSGYPLDKDGKPDLAGHRSYHESLIEQAKARTEFWHKLFFELSKWGLIGFAFWALTHLWKGFIEGPE